MALVKQTSSVVCFDLMGRRFGVPLSFIEGVASLPEVVAVPQNRSRVFIGFAYVLGQIVSVVDVAPLFNLSPASAAKDVLLVQIDKEYYAIKVDTVGEIASVTKSSKPASPSARGLRSPSRSATGVTLSTFEHKKKRITVLDVEKLIREHVCS